MLRTTDIQYDLDQELRRVAAEARAHHPSRIKRISLRDLAEALGRDGELDVVFSTAGVLVLPQR